MKKITSLSELRSMLAAAKCGGQFVSVSYETKVYGLNQYPTDGSLRVKREFEPKKRATASFHFGEDYDKKMSKLLGEDYKAEDDNREHLIHNVLMRYKSNGNVCMIAMPTNVTKLGYYLDGKALTPEQVEHINHYWSKAKKSEPLVEYRTIGVLNIFEIKINKEVYEVKIASLEE